MVDDAHAIGVLGESGAGTSSHFRPDRSSAAQHGHVQQITGEPGRFIASDAATIDYLKHHSRPLIFSASMSPANTAAALAALQIMLSEPERIAQLWRNTERMHHGLISLGFDLGNSETPILPVYCRDLVATFKFCKLLEEAGVFVNPVVSQQAVLWPLGRAQNDRISLMATHTDRQIDLRSTSSAR